LREANEVSFSNAGVSSSDSSDDVTLAIELFTCELFDIELFDWEDEFVANVGNTTNANATNMIKKLILT
ncbi:MAG: hypothetical protein WCC79_11010, partial [Nitrososphaeraceae archaeon]